MLHWLHRRLVSEDMSVCDVAGSVVVEVGVGVEVGFGFGAGTGLVAGLQVAGSAVVAPDQS